MYKINKTNIARLLEVKTRFEKKNKIMISMENFIVILLDMYEKDYTKIENRILKRGKKTDERTRD